METGFDKVAANYDETFTRTAIGELQRDLTYRELSKHLSTVQNILEINCGTGEDAIWLAKQNFKVTATDVSAKMIDVAKSKTTLEHLNFHVVDINILTSTFQDTRFDLIFSNFGGLNCLSVSELERFFKNAPSLLTDNGKLFLVIMPKNTLWEQAYFFTKAQFKNIFRRKRESVLANVSGENIKTYYYNPKDIVNLADAYFETTTIKPVGFFVPPSYLEPFFKNKKRVLGLLNTLEQQIKNKASLSKYADHYLIVLQKR